MKHLFKLVISASLLSVLSMSAVAANPAECPRAVTYSGNAGLLDTTYQVDENTMMVFSSGSMRSGRQTWQLAAVTDMADDAVAIQNARASAQAAQGPAERDEYEDYESGSHYIVCTYRDGSAADQENNETLFAFVDLSNYNAKGMQSGAHSNKGLKLALKKALLQHKK